MIVNYGKVDNVIRNIIFTINALKTANNQLENEISRLSNCKGTTENPHNHSSEIASIRKTIDNNEEKIKKLEIICNGLSNFKSDVFKKDIDLSRLFENNDLLEKIMQKVISPYKCPYEDEQMLTDEETTNGEGFVEGIKKENTCFISDKYVFTSDQYDDNCCKASCAMLAKINSNGIFTAQGTGVISYNEDIYNRQQCIGADEYESDRIGFYDYQGLSMEELTRIVTNEIDCGRVVQLHTRYAKNEHWVVVSSYILDDDGNIYVSYKNGDYNRAYISGLGGVDPEEQHVERITQKTQNLGEKATVDSSGGQWLNTDTGGYQVRTFNIGE